MKTAKEMFEEMEFKLIENYSPNIIHYERNYIEDDTYEELEIVEFFLKDLTISMARKIINLINDCIDYGAFNNIDIDLLQAINKQVEELGIDEN